MLNPVWPDVTKVVPSGVESVLIDPRTCDSSAINQAEFALVAGAPLDRRREYSAGRIGARKALARLGVLNAPLVANPDGSPAWPADVRGSISHKSGLCVAVACHATTSPGLGVDVERAAPMPESTWATVLTEAEQVAWTGRDIAHGARLAFSAKEAYYKWFGSLGRAGRPTFHDVELCAWGDEIDLLPSPGSTFPAVSGRCVVTVDWVVVVLWGGASSPRTVCERRSHAGSGHLDGVRGLNDVPQDRVRASEVVE